MPFVENFVNKFFEQNAKKGRIGQASGFSPVQFKKDLHPTDKVLK